MKKAKTIFTYRRILIIGLIAVATAAIAAIVFVSSSQARPKPIFFLPPNGEKIIYLASGPKTLASDLLISKASLQQQGVTVVFSYEDLNSLVESSDIDAIIFHGSHIKEVDQNWISGLYQKGVVIAGVNVTIRELAKLVGDSSIENSSAWKDGWQKDHFYSIVTVVPGGTLEEQQRAQSEGVPVPLGQSMRSTDNLTEADDALVFLSLIRRNIDTVTQITADK